MGFQTANRLRVDKVRTAGCFSVLPLLRIINYEESDRGQTMTAKKPSKSMNSHQKTQEYIKGKAPLFI